MKTPEQHYQHYIGTTYAGKHLGYPLTEYGTWKVLGEDPNCDMGGPHHEPHLATLTGTLEDVIRKAVTMNGFWAWGGGGRFVKINVETIPTKDKAARIAELKQTIENAQNELKTLTEKPKNVGMEIKKGAIVRFNGKKLLEVTEGNYWDNERGIWSSIWCDDHRAYFTHKGNLEIIRA